MMFNNLICTKGFPENLSILFDDACIGDDIDDSVQPMLHSMFKGGNL